MLRKARYLPWLFMILLFMTCITWRLSVPLDTKSQTSKIEDVSSINQGSPNSVTVTPNISDSQTQTNSDITSSTNQTTENHQDVKNKYTLYYTKNDIKNIAKVLYRECRGDSSITRQACVVWVILNRVDYSGRSIYQVITDPNQFAWNPDTPVWENLYDLAEDVLIRWNDEKNGIENVGRVLPKEYRYFYQGPNGYHVFLSEWNNSQTILKDFKNSPYKN